MKNVKKLPPIYNSNLVFHWKGNDHQEFKIWIEQLKKCNKDLKLIMESVLRNF